MCTARLAASEDFQTFCAVKFDGRLTCWDRDGWENQQATMLAAEFASDSPPRRWTDVAVSDVDFQACAIDDGGQVACHAGLGARLWTPPSNLRFLSYVPTSDGNCGLLDDHSPVCFEGATLPGDFAGAFKEIRASSFEVYGLDADDHLHGPSYRVGSFPTGRYSDLAVNNAIVCAVRDDGRVFCSPTDLPPPAEPGYVHVAMNHAPGTACALRTDGSVFCWGMWRDSPPVQAPQGTFTSLAGSDASFCGIRTDGTTACWGPDIFGPPPSPPAGW